MSIPLPQGVENLLAGNTPSGGAAAQIQNQSKQPDADATPVNAGRDWHSQLGAAADSLGLRPTVAPVADQNESQSDYIARMTKGTNEAAKINPNPSAPGAWARNLLSGVMSGLGDAAHASDNLKPGQGALSGALNTLAAHSERLGREKQQQFENNLKMTKEQREAQNDSVSRAYTLAQTYNLGLTANKLSIENDQAAFNLRKGIYDEGKTAVDAFKKSHHTVQDGVSQNDVYKMMSDYAKNPEKGPDGKPMSFADKYTVVPSGEESATGPNGTKQTAPTYSLVTKSANPVQIDEQLHDYLVKNLPAGQVPPVGTEMKGDLFDSQMTQAAQVSTAKRAIEQFAGEDIKWQDDQNMRRALLTAGHFMAENVSDPFAGLNKGLQQANTHVAQAKEQLRVAQTAKDPASVEKAQGYLQQATKEQQDIETVINSPTLATAREKHWEITEKAKEKAQHDAAQHSELTAGRLVDAFEDPTQLSKRASTYNAQLDDADKYSMAMYGTHFNPAQRQLDYTFAKNNSTQNTLKYFNSLVGTKDHTGNLADLVKQSDSINRTEFPPLNDAEAWAKLKTGDPKMAAYLTTVTEVADQVAKILQGGGTGSGTSDAKLHQAQEMFQKGFTKDMMREVGSTLNGLLNNRQRELIGSNPYLLRQYGTDEQVQQALRNKDPWQSGIKTNQSTLANVQQQRAAAGLPTVGDRKQFKGVDYEFDGKQYNKIK
jgi:hypothetical protein